MTRGLRACVAEGLQPAAHLREVRQHAGGAPAAAARGRPERTGQERLDPTARGDPLQQPQRGPTAAGEPRFSTLHRQGEGAGERAGGREGGEGRGGE